MPPENLDGAGEGRRAHAASRSRPASASTTGIEFRELFELQAVDIIQPDIGHIGGILETRKLAATAETHYVLVAPHNVGGPVLTAANLHLGGVHAQLQDPGALQRLRRPGGAAGARPGCPPVVDGYFALPDAPGPGRRARRGLRRRAPEHRRALRPVPARLAFPRDQVDGGADRPRRGVLELGRRAGGRPRAGRGAGAGRLRAASAAPTASCSRAAGRRSSSATRSCPGHEWSGVVEAVGAGADPRLVGRKVVGEGFRNCQACDACRAGQTTLCEAPYEETGFTQPGAWNDFLRLPARLLHVLPEDADLRAAALLEPAACIAEACLLAALGPRRAGRGGRRRHARAALRAAAAGVLAARAGGGRAADRSARRWRAAWAPTGWSTPDAARSRLRRRHRGGRDAGLGAARGRHRAPRRAGGADGHPGRSRRRRLTRRSSSTQAVTVFNVFGAPSRAWVHTVRAFAAGLLDPTPLITHELPLSEIREAFRVMTEDPAVGKILLRP